MNLRSNVEPDKMISQESSESYNDIKDALQTVEDLKFKNILLSTIQEVSIDGILVVDENGKILLFNKRFIEMWNIPADVIESKSDELALQSVLKKLVDPNEFITKVTYLYKHQNEVSRDEIQLIDNRVFDRYSAPMIGPDGKYYGRVWYFRNITEQKLFENSLKKHQVQLQDIVKERTAELESMNTQLTEEITERKFIEDSLRESEEQFRSLYENISIGLYRTTPDGKILLSNPALVKMLGYSSFEELSKRNLEVEEYEPRYSRSQFRKRLETEGEFRGNETSWKKNDGTFIFVRESAKAIRDINGKTLYYEGTVEDITEHKRSLEELQKQEAEFNAIFDSITDGIVFSNLERKIVTINPAFVKMFGYTIEELRDQSTKILYPDEISYQTQREKYRIGDLTGQNLFELTLKHKDGTTFPVETLGIPVKNSRGEIIGFVGIHRNISERKKAEAEHLRLENLQSIEILAGGIAHDFRNILTVIMGQASLAKVKCHDDNIQKNISGILEATKKASELTEHLLTFAKGGVANKQAVLIRELIDQAARDVLYRSNIEVVTDFNDTLLVETDISEFAQVVRSIVINAKESMPKGGKLFITTQDFSESGKPSLKIIIKDTGVGIPEEHLDKIFHPYFSTKQRGKDKGSGLGLSICYAIIKKHRGKISVDSKIGIGTTFEISLPGVKDKI